MIKKRVSKELRERLTERRDQLLNQLKKLEEELKYLDESHPPEFSEEAQEKAAAISLLACATSAFRERALSAEAMAGSYSFRLYWAVARLNQAW